MASYSGVCSSISHSWLQTSEYIFDGLHLSQWIQITLYLTGVLKIKSCRALRSLDKKNVWKVSLLYFHLNLIPLGNSFYAAPSNLNPQTYFSEWMQTFSGGCSGRGIKIYTYEYSALSTFIQIISKHLTLESLIHITDRKTEAHRS